MRLVSWFDDNGYMRKAYVRDSDPDDVAPSIGIPHDPPDLSSIDWDEVQRELHNALSNAGLTTWRDVQQQQNSLVPVISTVLKRKLIALYREKT